MQSHKKGNDTAGSLIAGLFEGHGERSLRGTAPVNGFRDSMKHELVNLMYGAGLFAPFRRSNRGKSLILMYHRFRTEADGISTSARCFTQQLDYLSEHYEIVPLSALAGYLTSGAPVPPGLAAITIDDGYRDCYDIAYPILRQRKIPATAFVVTDFLDQETWLWTDKVRYLTSRASSSLLEAHIDDHSLRIKLDGHTSRLKGAEQVNAELKMIDDEAKDNAIRDIASTLEIPLPDVPPAEFLPLTWEQVREMDSNGIEIGSHTVTHPILTKISGKRLTYELGESRSRLESELRRNVELLGYPNGNHNLVVQQEAARVGYKCAVTADYGLNNGNSNPLALKRVHAEHHIAHFVKNTSGFEQFRNRFSYSGGASCAALDQSIDTWN